MAFLALRTHYDDANHVSYPMAEIEIVAKEIEDYFGHFYPLTLQAFNEFGREGP
jgi:hypothetical protein